MKYLFGPVQSRRLGVSLGIDLLPFKTCSLNCIYCECGPTNNLTTEIKEYVPTSEVINELKIYLSAKPKIDFITFSGSGEPTLHSGIGEIINFIKTNFPQYKICLLTNSTLLYKASVRMAIKNCDLIMPSFDAYFESSLRKVLRAYSDVTVSSIIGGIRKICEEKTCPVIIEYFVIPGINDSLNELTELKKFFLDIKPDAIQLNYLARPGASVDVPIASVERLSEIKDFFKPLLVQPIKKLNIHPAQDEETIKSVLEIINKGISIDDLIIKSGIRANDLMKIIGELENRKLIKTKTEERDYFFKKK